MIPLYFLAGKSEKLGKALKYESHVCSRVVHGVVAILTSYTATEKSSAMRPLVSIQRWLHFEF